MRLMEVVAQVAETFGNVQSWKSDDNNGRVNKNNSFLNSRFAASIVTCGFVYEQLIFNYLPKNRYDRKKLNPNTPFLLKVSTY